MERKNAVTKRFCMDKTRFGCVLFCVFSVVMDNPAIWRNRDKYKLTYYIKSIIIFSKQKISMSSFCGIFKHLPYLNIGTILFVREILL